jgi:hypothetical protein
VGDADAARGLLREIRRVEAGVGDDLPGQARTLLLSIRAAHALGEPPPPPGEVAALVERGLDPVHPILLEITYDEAARLGSRRPEAVARLLAPLLSRAPLDHGRPALGDGHPLYQAARALAEQVGAARPLEENDRFWDDY